MAAVTRSSIQRRAGAGAERARTVVVTGATGGIGRATVRTLVKLGFTVWAAAHEEGGRAALAAEFGGQVSTVAFDLADDAAVAWAAEQSLRPGRCSRW